MGTLKAYQRQDGAEGIAPLTQVARNTAEGSYVDGYEATEEEALGVAIAHHFRWDGLAILRCFSAALEDANFHTENETVARWIDEISEAVPPSKGPWELAEGLTPNMSTITNTVTGDRLYADFAHLEAVAVRDALNRVARATS